MVSQLNRFLDPINLHTNAMNRVDQANRSKSYILFKTEETQSFILCKMAEQSRANAEAVATGFYAAAYFAGKFVVSIPAALLKKALVVDICELKKKLPDFSDCHATAVRALKLWIGIFVSVSGVCIIGSKFNAAEQRKLGNCEKYDSEIRSMLPFRNAVAKCKNKKEDFPLATEELDQRVYKFTYPKGEKGKAIRNFFHQRDVHIVQDDVQDNVYPEENYLPLKELKPDPTRYYKPLDVDQLKKVDEFWRREYDKVISSIKKAALFEAAIFGSKDDEENKVDIENNKRLKQLYKENKAYNKVYQERKAKFEYLDIKTSLDRTQIEKHIANEKDINDFEEQIGIPNSNYGYLLERDFWRNKHKAKYAEVIHRVKYEVVIRSIPQIISKEDNPIYSERLAKFNELDKRIGVDIQNIGVQNETEKKIDLFMQELDDIYKLKEEEINRSKQDLDNTYKLAVDSIVYQYDDVSEDENTFQDIRKLMQLDLNRIGEMSKEEENTIFPEGGQNYLKGINRYVAKYPSSNKDNAIEEEGVKEINKQHKDIAIEEKEVIEINKQDKEIDIEEKDDSFGISKSDPADNNENDI